MLKTTLSAAAVVAFGAFAAFPVQAGSPWNERVDLCAQALAAEGLVNIDDYRVRFLSGAGGATKKVSVSLLPNNDGEKLTAQCKIRRGEVISVELKA